jgi:hypothetical protein
MEGCLNFFYQTESCRGHVDETWELKTWKCGTHIIGGEVETIS